MSKSTKSIFSSLWFHGLARFFLISSAVTALILSFYHSLHSYQYVYSEGMFSRIGTNSAIAFALPLLVLALIAWFRPHAGGIAAALWILTILVIFIVRLIGEYFDGYDNSIFWPIGIVYLVGAVMHLCLPRQKENSIIADARFRWAAVIVTFAAPLLYFILLALVFAFRWPGGMGAGLLFFTPLAIILGIVAVAWPFYGGISIIIIGSLFFSLTLVTDHYPMYYVPISSVFIIGGALHLMRERLFGWPHLSMPRLSPRI
jgi:hypothetical protein